MYTHARTYTLKHNHTHICARNYSYTSTHMHRCMFIHYLTWVPMSMHKDTCTS